MKSFQLFYVLRKRSAMVLTAYLSLSENKVNSQLTSSFQQLKKLPLTNTGALWQLAKFRKQNTFYRCFKQKLFTGRELTSESPVHSEDS